MARQALVMAVQPCHSSSAVQLPCITQQVNGFFCSLHRCLFTSLCPRWMPSRCMQRHSDHHAHPARRYQALRHFAQAPQLPAGYATMITVAYIPSLWFALMDKRLVKHYRHDLKKINIQPTARERLQQRWA
jgi:hypothetical protein